MDEKKSRLFLGHFGRPGNVPPPGDPIGVTAIEVAVDRIQFFDKNPRRTENPLYAEIKESIRQVGLENPLPVSRRQSDLQGHYFIYKGGNTRLRALKELWEETHDPQFYMVKCIFHPYISDTDALIAHLRENDLRGTMTFIDRALSVQAAKEQLEKEVEKNLSLRELEALFKQRGFPISFSMISKLEYAAGLHKSLPRALGNGLGKDQIERLSKLERVSRQVWQFHCGIDGSTQQFRDNIFLPMLAQTDSDDWAYDKAENLLKERLQELVSPEARSHLLTNFKLALDGKDLKPLPSIEPEPVVTVKAVEPVSSPEGHEAKPDVAVAAIPSTMASPPATPISQECHNDNKPSGGHDVSERWQQLQEWGEPESLPDDFDLDAAADDEIEADLLLGSGASDFSSVSESHLAGYNAHLTPVRDIVIEGTGRWIDRLKILRQRCHELALKLASIYVPNADDTVVSIETGVGFILVDTFNFEYVSGLLDRFESAQDSDAERAIHHTASLWWFLSEVSGMWLVEAMPLWDKYIPPDGTLRDGELLRLVHPVSSAEKKHEAWWMMLPPSQLNTIAQLLAVAHTIYAIVADHAEEADNASVWEIQTP